MYNKFSNYSFRKMYSFIQDYTCSDIRCVFVIIRGQRSLILVRVSSAKLFILQN